MGVCVLSISFKRYIYVYIYMYGTHNYVSTVDFIKALGENSASVSIDNERQSQWEKLLTEANLKRMKDFFAMFDSQDSRNRAKCNNHWGLYSKKAFCRLDPNLFLYYASSFLEHEWFYKLRISLRVYKKLITFIHMYFFSQNSCSKPFFVKNTRLGYRQYFTATWLKRKKKRVKEALHLAPRHSSRMYGFKCEF